MGTWSQPLFATVSPGIPEDYSITLSELPDKVVEEWRHGAFFQTEDKDTYTLSEFMDTGYECHRIMDYMNDEQIQRWIALFAYLAKKYPALNTVAFHIYCSDEHMPYYFKWDRAKEGIESLHLNMHIGYRDCVYYFTLEEGIPVFHREMYEKYWRKMSHTVKELRVRPGLKY
jgi:hypothetical protein